LREEVTINEPADFRVWRRPEGKPHAPKAWRELRRSVADLARRAEIGRAATDRHLGALAAAHHGAPLSASAAAVCRPLVRKGRRHRALHPLRPVRHRAVGDSQPRRVLRSTACATLNCAPSSIRSGPPD